MRIRRRVRRLRSLALSLEVARLICCSRMSFFCGGVPSILQGFTSQNPARRKGQGRRVAIFHLDVKTGTRGGGQTASAKYDYLGREGRYAKDAAELEYKESGNMPKWAEDDPGKYWQAADEHERTNGRLFQQVEVALPVELDERQRRDLARSFARQLTDQERKRRYATLAALILDTRARTAAITARIPAIPSKIQQRR